MEIAVLFFLLHLCYTSSPTTVSTKAQEGYCPQHATIKVTKPSCLQDSDCELHKKCCQMGRYTKCVKGGTLKIKHRGDCPVPGSNITMEYIKPCNGDSDCFGKDKCCPHRSKLVCLPPKEKKSCLRK
uniref:WAP domain-containing protein n=1 Tax=Trichuris muris TaxID=70415 RepID=A0A5S6QIK9_TRIMR